MSHLEQRAFFAFAKSMYPEFFQDVSVIEIGSLNINGSIREFYSNCNYLGVDVAPGKDVDLVVSGHELKFPNGSFSVAASAECFEHNPHWKETFNNMYEIASDFVIFSCASDGRPEHGTARSEPEASPFTIGWDYYRNLNRVDFTSNFNIESMFKEHYFFHNRTSKDLYFWGLK